MPSSRRRRRPYTASRCLFITSSYSRRCLRDSKCCPSTAFCAEGFEVLPFDRLLCSLDAAGDHLRFDGNALFHPQFLQQGRDPFLGEDAHEIIFEREIKTRRAGIALAAGASAKLVVDSPRLVALGAENVQTANRSHFVVLYIGLRLIAGECFRPLICRNGEFVAVVIKD